MNNLKTVSQVAKEINVSRQTVYNYVKRIREETPVVEMDSYLVEIDNVVNLTVKAQDYIKNQLGIEQPINNDPELEPGTAEITFINNVLLEQIRIKDEQIKELQEIIKVMQQKEIAKEYVKALDSTNSENYSFFTRALQKLTKIFTGENK